MAMGRHAQLEVAPGDTVVMSAHIVPGNEEMVYRIINRLFQRGAEVIYSPLSEVHVSGHARQEEQKLLINLVRPSFFVPIHGELRHLNQHAKMARELGIPADNIAVVENGTVLEFGRQSMHVGERVPGGYVFVDGSTVGDVGPAVLRDRENLGRSGFLMAMVTVDGETGEMVREPEVISRGFVFMREADELMEIIRDTIVEVLEADCADAKTREKYLHDRISRVIYKETRRRPMVFTMVNEV
jgi:ribonuclease J